MGETSRNKDGKAGDHFTAPKEELAQLKCPVCEVDSVHHRKLVHWGEMRRCLVCGLVFANPLQLPQHPQDFFENAYQGNIKESKMEEFNNRLNNNHRMAKSNFSPPLGNTKLIVMKWIKEHLQPGSYVMDIGCGPGYFLDALRDAGFKPIGLEPAISVVETLRQRGHTVLHGTPKYLDDITDNFLEISACTCFYVLHHSADPLGFFKAIRRLFPNATLLLIDGAWWRHPYPQPPRHFTMWTADSLSFALRKAGYEPEVIELPRKELDLGLPIAPFLPILTANERFMLLYRFYRRIKPVLLWPLAQWQILYGKPRVLFACAKPIKEK